MSFAGDLHTHTRNLAFELGLVIESDGDLVVESSKYLTVEVLLRLVSERHPAKNLIAYSAGNLPVLPSFLVEGVRQGGAQPVYMQVTVPKKAILPAIQPPTIGTMIAPPVPVSPLSCVLCSPCLSLFNTLREEEKKLRE